MYEGQFCFFVVVSLLYSYRRHRLCDLGFDYCFLFNLLSCYSLKSNSLYMRDKCVFPGVTLCYG